MRGLVCKRPSDACRAGRRQADPILLKIADLVGMAGKCPAIVQLFGKNVLVLRNLGTDCSVPDGAASKPFLCGSLPQFDPGSCRGFFDMPIETSLQPGCGRSHLEARRSQAHGVGCGGVSRPRQEVSVRPARTRDKAKRVLASPLAVSPPFTPKPLLINVLSTFG
jgi:hypothetical protein